LSEDDEGFLLKPIRNVLIFSAFFGSELAVAGDTGDAVAMVESIQQSVRNQKGQLRFCFEQRLRAMPSLSGTLVVLMEVAKGGVNSVSVLSNSTGDRVLEDCFLTQISDWVFESEIDLSVEYPFHLSASKAM